MTGRKRKLIILFIRLLAAVILAFLAGKLISKFKLPSILGWLIAGMVLGPHALSLMDHQILDAQWYQTIVHILECAVGLMIGTELVWSKIKRSGKAIVITTFTQSIGTFLFVSLVFGIVFYLQDIPLYLAFLFGGIALATAPAPALSIVREFKADGPVTNTLIPMAALDDIVGCIVFFTTVAICCRKPFRRRASGIYDRPGCNTAFGYRGCSRAVSRPVPEKREKLQGYAFAPDTEYSDCVRRGIYI